MADLMILGWVPAGDGAVDPEQSANLSSTDVTTDESDIVIAIRRVWQIAKASKNLQVHDPEERIPLPLFLSDKSETDSSLESIIAALAEAEEVANRINDSMDRSHELAQESIRDLRATNELLRESNTARAKTRKKRARSGESTKNQYGVATAA